LQVEFTIVFEDIIVFFVAVIYAVIILTIADVGRRKMNLSPDISRKIVHLFAGAAIWTHFTPILGLPQSWRYCLS